MKNKLGVLMVAMLVLSLTAISAFAIPYPNAGYNPLGTQWSGGGRTNMTNAVDIGFYKGSDFRYANGFVSIMYDARTNAMSKGSINVVGISQGTRPTTYTYDLSWNSAAPSLVLLADTTTKTKFTLVATEVFSGAPYHTTTATFVYDKLTRQVSVQTDYAKLNYMQLTTAYLS